MAVENNKDGYASDSKYRGGDVKVVVVVVRMAEA